MYAFVARRTGIVNDKTRKTHTRVGALAATATYAHTAINLTAKHATHMHTHTQAFTNIQHMHTHVTARPAAGGGWVGNTVAHST